jgi:hypothetical protein
MTAPDWKNMQSRSRIGRTFRAAFPSTCGCGNSIFVDDDVAYVDDEVACEECVDTARLESEYDG